MKVLFVKMDEMHFRASQTKELPQKMFSPLQQKAWATRIYSFIRGLTYFWKFRTTFHLWRRNLINSTLVSTRGTVNCSYPSSSSITSWKHSWFQHTHATKCRKKTYITLAWLTPMPATAIMETIILCHRSTLRSPLSIFNTIWMLLLTCTCPTWTIHSQCPYAFWALTKLSNQQLEV